ncbi:MAG TPA: tetratricopeptide repeat protein [Gaiellaceae bacterium]|nr:tetratricopeptide repeat protein [Gaiellaceae bacterium]
MADTGIDAAPHSDQDAQAMNEPAALITPASAGLLVLPPVTDIFRDDELDVLETKVAGAEVALRDARYDDVVAILNELAIFPAQFPNLALRALLAESWARMYRGELDEALAKLKTAKQITHRPGFNDLDRAGVLCRIGAVRVKRGSISRAVNDLTLALELCNRSGRPSDRLRAEIYDWRSRCYQRQRDFRAARADIEAALELCDSIGDLAAAADINFRAASIAEREGKFLVARCYAEKARDFYARVGDRANLGRVLNDLGGITFLLGKHEEAIEFLQQAVSTLFDAAGDVETGYAVSSLAQVYLRTGKPELAEKQARTALELLGDREDVREETGNVQLVLGRALMELGNDAEADESFAAAEASFAERESASLLAAAWMARGELALDRDDSVSAAQLYRQAAEALSDFHF